MDAGSTRNACPRMTKCLENGVTGKLLSIWPAGQASFRKAGFTATCQRHEPGDGLDCRRWIRHCRYQAQVNGGQMIRPE
jgi:hypothetical protein